MGQAKTFIDQEIERLRSFIATQPQAERNRAMVLVMFWAGRNSECQQPFGQPNFITHLAKKSVSVRVLASLVDYRSIATTQRYIDVNDEIKRQAVDLI